MSNLGDLHNFGRSVGAVEGASGIYFQKPRPVYWEWLFFGNTSPLASLFSIETSSGFNPMEILFGLDVEVAADFTGASRKVEASPGASSTRNAYSLGVLLSYCYVFGIRDLHCYNVIPCKTGLQVVDAEVVFTSLLLPNESILLPFKSAGWDLAAVYHLAAQRDVLGNEQIEFIFSGYCDAFDCFRRNMSSIGHIFSERRSELARVPIRHIMRDTAEYHARVKNGDYTDLSDDELVQLRRGDIPYYFKFLHDSNLYCYTDAHGSFAPVAFPARFTKDVARAAAGPDALLLSERILDRLLPTGLLYLGKHLWQPDQDHAFQSGGVEVRAHEKSISVTVGDKTFQSTRA